MTAAASPPPRGERPQRQGIRAGHRPPAPTGTTPGTSLYKPSAAPSARLAKSNPQSRAPVSRCTLSAGRREAEQTWRQYHSLYFPKRQAGCAPACRPLPRLGPDNSNSIPRVPVPHNGAQEASPSPSDDTTLSPAPRPPCLPGPHPSCTERAKGSWAALQPPQRQKKQKQKREERACLSIGEREFSTEIRPRPLLPRLCTRGQASTKGRGGYGHRACRWRRCIMQRHSGSPRRIPRGSLRECVHPHARGTIGRADHEISGPSSRRCSLHGQESGGRVECGPLARDAAGPTPKGHKRERPCTGDHAPKNLATLAPCRTARPIPISHAALALARPLGVGCTCGWRSGDPGDTHVRPIRPPRYRNYPPGSGT